MKKLIEVALPLEAISEAAESEKDIHTGTPANLHTWWSRKPLSACRAILFASLVDDPSEYIKNETQAHAERERLFDLIIQLVEWENNNNEDLLDGARFEIAKSVARNLGVDVPVGKAAIREFLATKAPPVLDPFAGGGSIPLEAQRLGLRTYASDLNPVAVLINKAMIEIPPGFANMPPVHPTNDGNRTTGDGKKRSAVGRQLSLQAAEWKGSAGLAEDVRYYGNWMRDEAGKRIGHLYPRVKLPQEYGGAEALVIAWIWARTIECPNPICRTRTPLVNKFWISTHKGNEVWVKPITDLEHKRVNFEIERGSGHPQLGTVKKSGAHCLGCDKPISLADIRVKGRGGKIEYQLMAIATEGSQKRIYLPPTASQSQLANQANPNWIPSTSLPEKALGFRVQRYGMIRHSDLFTARQLAAITTFSDLLELVRNRIIAETNNPDYALAIVTYLSLAVNRLAQTNNTLVRWLVRKSGTSKGTPAFDRQTVSMVWEFSEGNVFSDSVGSWSAALNNVLSAFKVFPNSPFPGAVEQVDASSRVFSTIPPVVSTDPPYFDNIGYADLSDFYYIWLRKSLANYYPNLFSTMLVPKQQELIAGDHLFAGDSESAKEHFMIGLNKAFARIRNHANRNYPVTVYYAFKQKEESEEGDDEADAVATSTGWETMLDALVAAGFSVSGTWPVRTGQSARIRAIESNALSTSVVLVCRPRPEDAQRATRREFLSALKKELPPALRVLQQGNIAPVDLDQASIGPGMAIFSKYREVLEPDGTAMRVRTALALINQALDEYLTEQEGEYDADTRWALAWFEQYGHEAGPFGVAETLSKAKNTGIDGLVRAGILASRGGQVHLLKRDELPKDWDPQTDARLTAWETVQYLVRALDQGGEQSAAAQLKKLGSHADTARDLAYRLFALCERKGWAQDALGYNMLVVAWQRLVELGGRGETRQDALM